MAEENIIQEDRYFMIFNNYKVKESDLQKFINSIGPEEAVVLLVHASIKAGSEGCYTKSESDVLQKCLNTLIKNDKVGESKDVL